MSTNTEKNTNAVRTTELMFNDAPVRMCTIDNETWWIAKDVCEVLGLANVGQALTGLDDDEKSDIKQAANIITDDVDPYGMLRNHVFQKPVEFVEANTGGRPLAIVNESGLYSLIFKSRKPEAQAFRRWVTHEVLPAIRKTGFYVAPGGQLHDPLADIPMGQTYVSAKYYAEKAGLPAHELASFSQSVAYLCRAFGYRTAIHSHTRERLYPVSAMSTVIEFRNSSRKQLTFNF